MEGGGGGVPRYGRYGTFVVLFLAVAVSGEVKSLG